MNLKITRVALTVIAAGVVTSFSSNVDATQFKKIINGKEVVVHTNPIPVVLHRLVPPQHGRHVTIREINQGAVPSSGRILGQIRK